MLFALVAALTFKGLVTLGVLPGVATFVDLPLSWLAFALAVARSGRWSPPARRLGWLIAFLALSVVLAWVVHPAELLRPVVYLILLGQPFVLVAALVIDPPSPRLRSALELCVVALLAVQIPIMAWQSLYLGPGDAVQGTLYGSGAGAHVISAVAVAGGLWLLVSDRWPGPLRVALVVCLLAVPFVADAKQVVFAMPALLAGVSWGRYRKKAVLLAVVVAASLVILVTVYRPGRTGLDILGAAALGESGKQVTVEIVWDHLTEDPATFLFGLGPAQTVSRAAFMTTDLFLGADSPLRSLGLAPAAIAVEVQQRADEASGGGTSFDSGVSSAFGVLGDLGLVGVVAYASLLASVFLFLRRIERPQAMVAAGAWAMFAVLGFVYDWWEQPPFSVLLAVISGLALVGPDVPDDLRRADE